jgi:ADP-heptose:LPS heptosyltransferase
MLPTETANLVVRPEKLGDLIVATPVFRAFKESYPNQPLHLLTDDVFADAVRHDPHLDKIITVRWKGRKFPARESWRGIRRQLSPHRYQRAALLYYNCEGLNWLMASLRVPEVAQLGGTVSSLLLGHRYVLRKMFQERAHYSEWYLRVAALLGATTTSRMPALYLTPEETAAFAVRFPFIREKKKKRILIHPFGNGSAPNYSVEAYARLAALLCANPGIDVFISGTPSEQQRWQQVAPQIPVRTDWLGALNIREWMVAATQVDLVIAGSTGVIHASAALGTATLGLYCPYVGSHPDIWGPLGPRVYLMIVPTKSCRAIQPCETACTGNGQCDLSFALSPEMVAQKAMELLG